MKKVLAAAAILVLTVACVSLPGPLVQNGAGGDSAEEIIRDYINWDPLFQTVQTISFQLMLMCRLMTEQEEAYVASEHGQSFVQVYANPLAEPTMRLEGKRNFPHGSVIVKEKLAQDPRLANANVSVKPIGLGIMIKREPDYDAAGGDWEYLYVDDAGIITRDQKQLQHCRTCHMANEEQDAIFYPRLFEN